MSTKLPETAIVCLFQTPPRIRPVLGLVIAVGGGLGLVSPASAATFAFSQSAVTLSNFSSSALTNITIADKNDFVIALSDQADVVSTSTALASFPLTSALSQARSIVEGTSGRYEGIGTSTAGIIGTFQVENLFTFDLRTFLNVGAGVDDPGTEKADAIGSIEIRLEDITDPNAPTLLDELIFKGSAAGNSPIANFSRSSTSGFSIDSNPAPNIIAGSYRHQFNRSTTLRLTEIKNHRAAVSTPEPGTLLSLWLAGSAIVFCKKKRQEHRLP